MEEESLNTIDKMLYNNNNLQNYITKGNIININEKIEFWFTKNKDNYDLDYEDNYLFNCEEEFLEDDSLSISQEQKNLNKDNQKTLISSNNFSFCLILDKIINNDLKVKKHFNFNKRYSNFKNNEVIKNKNKSCLNKFKFYEFNNLLNKIEKNELFNSICSICFNNFTFDEEISLINNCLHIFHSKCLNEWIEPLKLNKKYCPYCKLSILKNLKK